MKKYKLFLFLSCLNLFLLSSCDKDRIKISEDYKLEYGETANFNKGDFNIRFDEVLGDSRCPFCCICAWAGAVTVRLIIEEDNESTTIEMVMSGGFIPNQNFQTVEYQDYSIELKAVNPYPEDIPVEETEYNIIFNISQL